jgi:hypothetical protein
VDPEFLRQAAKAVFHYFRHEEQRQTVTMGEFAGALEKVIFGLKLVPESPTPETVVAEADLGRIACASGAAFELMFFPLLRAELKEKLSLSPRVLRFRGLRMCVKRLTRAQRWSRRCQELQHQIVRYLRGCLSTERCADGFSLVVE